MSTIVYGLLGLFILYWANYLRCLQKNLSDARQSGLPYVITPIYFLNRTWLIQSRLWLPLLRKLPTPIGGLWVDMLDNEWIWKFKRRPFDVLGCNAFIVVAPGKNSLFVADPDAISQITTRRNDFPKPVNIYTSVDIYGKNVVSTEGSIWRHHRKITSPPFTEKNNHMVWQESLLQAQSMISAWFQGGKKEDSGPIIDVAAAAMRLSLHVISMAGFGVRLYWPHEEQELKGKVGEIPEGHTMTYKDALSTLLENIIAAFLLPKWMLKYAPFKVTRTCYEALENWRGYMQEMYDAKKAEFQNGTAPDSGMDLMGALVKGAGIAPSDGASAEKGTGQLLADSEILGNAFVFILAGHETAANTIHFSLLLLAMNPASQRRLQKDLDDIFGSRPVSQWNYDEDIPRLFGSMAGAVMNEELRLVPPVVAIPKTALDAQPLTVDGRRVTVPAGTMINLNTIAAHTDRKTWPTLCPTTASDAEKDADLLTFKPERWLLDPNNKSQKTNVEDEADRGDDIGGPQSSDTSSALFKPARGAYLPFSEGYRACLGRRFAQVEVLAVLAVLFREYSVELAVEEILGEQFPFPTGEEEVKDCKREGTGRAEWDRARERAEGLFKTAMGTIITLQMREGKVPVRIVKRGGERFKY
ncbi:Cytochrome P450-like protein 53 [Elsinoe fawcettii]|nr:Cytochrome P450-like protein 53 [Elsinoe fawcettii]